MLQSLSTIVTCAKEFNLENSQHFWISKPNEFKELFCNCLIYLFHVPTFSSVPSISASVSFILHQSSERRGGLVLKRLPLKDIETTLCKLSAVFTDSLHCCFACLLEKHPQLQFQLTSHKEHESTHLCIIIWNTHKMMTRRKCLNFIAHYAEISFDNSVLSL